MLSFSTISVFVFFSVTVVAFFKKFYLILFIYLFVSNRWRVGMILAFCIGAANRSLVFPLQVSMKQHCSVVRLTTAKG